METIKIECESCGGTGVYHGFAEPEGFGVVCLRCDGSGARDFSYKTFTQRKRRKDIQYVTRSRGTFIGTGVGPVGGNVSYADFLNGTMPKP